MAIRIGQSWVSEAAYAKARAQAGQPNAASNSYLGELEHKFPDLSFSTNMKPYTDNGTNNISISPVILRKMANDPEKRMEHEALLYDCQEACRTIQNQTLPGGGKRVGFGFIIDGQGNLSSWSISKSEGSGVKSSSCILPPDKPKNWLDMISESGMRRGYNSKGEKS